MVNAPHTTYYNYVCTAHHVLWLCIHLGAGSAIDVLYTARYVQAMLYNIFYVINIIFHSNKNNRTSTLGIRAMRRGGCTHTCILMRRVWCAHTNAYWTVQTCVSVLSAAGGANWSRFWAGWNWWQFPCNPLIIGNLLSHPVASFTHIPGHITHARCLQIFLCDEETNSETSIDRIEEEPRGLWQSRWLPQTVFEYFHDGTWNICNYGSWFRLWWKSCVFLMLQCWWLLQSAHGWTHSANLTLQ